MDNKSNKNFQSNLHIDDQIRIFDTTLRDGEQTPGVSVNPEKKN
jgi:2-isopropylmalate synthase